MINFIVYLCVSYLMISFLCFLSMPATKGFLVCSLKAILWPYFFLKFIKINHKRIWEEMNE
jgi:hypothetical protein